MSAPRTDRTGQTPARPGKYAILLAILILIAAFLLWRDEAAQRAALETEVRSELTSAANAALWQINEWRQERIGDVRAVSSDRAKLSLLRSIIAGRASAEAQADLRTWLDSAFHALRYAHAAVTDVDGRVVASSGAPIANPDDLQEFAVRTAAGNILYDDLKSQRPGEPVQAHLGLALRSDRNSPVFGVLVLTIDPRSYIFPFLQNRVGARSTFEFLIGRREGDQVVVLNSPHLGAHPPLGLRVPAASKADPLAQAAAGARGWLTGRDYRGADVYAVADVFPNLNWLILAKVDRNDVLAPHWRRSELLGVAALSVLVAAGVALVGYSRRQQMLLLRAELDRQALSSHVDLITRFANDVILLLDDEGRILEANDRAVMTYGYTLAELRQMTIRDLRVAEQRPAVEERWKEVEEQGSLIFESAHRRKDGSEFPAEASVRLFTIDGNKFAQVILRDITERKRAEKERAALQHQLLQAQRLETVGRLAGGVAHDFNNHLTVIRGYCDLLLRHTEADTTSRHRLEEIREAARCASDLTQQLLTFSRKHVAQPRRLSLNQLVTESSDMLSRLIGEEIAIVTNLFPLAEPVLADPVQMKQILMSLATNARDAMIGHGTLTIGTRNVEVTEEAAGRHADGRAGNYVVLSVSDTGTGMTDDTMQKIFDPFFTTKADRGTGLGLSTTYGIVRSAGGWISVSSRLGEGSVFEIYLPASPGPTEAQRQHAPAVAARDGAETVLVAEDHREIRELTVAILAEDGYRLLVAANGNEAIEVAERHDGPIDLLLSDVVMPGMGGPELARRLTAARPGVKVLFLSGYPSDSTGVRLLLEQGVPYLQKPFGPVELCGKVREVLGARAPRKTVLIADDDRLVREFLADVLVEAGYGVLTADGAEECLMAVRQRPVDLVLSDMIMPGMEGLELVRTLRRDHPRIPVVLMSGASHQGLIRAALHLGGSAVLSKPIAPAELLQHVRQILSPS